MLQDVSFFFVSVGKESATGCRLSVNKVVVLRDKIKETLVMFLIPSYTNVVVEIFSINRKPKN